MNKEKTRRKNAGTWWLVSTLVLIGFIGVSVFFNLYAEPRWFSESDKVNYVQEEKEEILKEMIPHLKNKNKNELKKIELKYGVLIEYLDADGSVIYVSLDDLKNDENSVETISDKDEGTKIVYMKSTDANYIMYEYCEDEELDVSVGIPQGNHLKLYFSTESYYETIEEAAKHRLIISLAIMIALWLFFTIIIYSISSYSAKIRKLNSAVKKVKIPEFSGRCPEDTSDVGTLGGNINILLDVAENQVKTLTKNNEIMREKLETKLKMEDEKKDFLANTAHEMKTPISIIQGYAEGLKLGIAKGGRARQKYCDIIIDETNKMNDLVLELLELSKYRQKMYEDVKEENISIRSFIQGNLNSMDPIFKENSIDVENTINRKFIGRTDIEKQNLVLRNYIKNAISHINMYKKIVISCEERPNAYRINVFNTGEHIPEENLKNIWDSFYRVDKSHSRSEGRFGIGLSIVASIQEALGMDYGVENVYGGVQFWFDVKKATKEDK